jgi:hypothetical protein
MRFMSVAMTRSSIPVECAFLAWRLPRGSRLSPAIRRMSERVALYRMGRTSRTCSGALPTTWTRFYAVQSRAASGRQPTNFDMIINLKTAKTLDLDVSTMFLARADDVIK